MSFSFISKISLYLFFLFIFSCQDAILSLDKKEILDIDNNNFTFEKIDLIDFNPIEVSQNNSIDIYTYQSSNYNFLKKDQKKIKINNYEKKYNFKRLINLILSDNNYYAVNSKGQLLKFDIGTGKLLERFNIELNLLNKEPVSFSLYQNDFIVGFNSGEVTRINKLGEIIWVFKGQDLLNTPITIHDNKVIILGSDKIFILDPVSGNVIYEKVFVSGNIIQSSGGKVQNYYNIIFFILPNSEFNALDTFLFEEHLLNFDKIELITSLNNLNDHIHVYKNYLVYLDNGNILHTYDLNTNQLILSDFRINNSSSVSLINNVLISKNESYINFYNIKNGNLFSKIDIKKILNKNSNIINTLIINNKFHLFTDNGQLLIFDKDLNILKTLNLKIKEINKVYSYQNNIFISTEKGITYIY